MLEELQILWELSYEFKFRPADDLSDLDLCEVDFNFFWSSPDCAGLAVVPFWGCSIGAWSCEVLCSFFVIGSINEGLVRIDSL